MSARPLRLPPSSPAAHLMGALVLGTLAFVACKADTEAFHERLFSCNPNAADPACGTDIDDKPMACVPAYQLGGTNFCAPGCDATTDLEKDPNAICVPSGKRGTPAPSGGLLPRCNPALLTNTCGPATSCLRTDLEADEGVCSTVSSCTTDSDCRDPVRSKCMGELLRETFPQAGFKSDHTYCLQAECRARRTACSPGETCMRDILPKASNPPDICVPHCDANGNCPPNYFCYPKLYGPGAPRVCIPGLLGLRCETRLDCLTGDCVETGAPYKVCTSACATDADCEKFDSIQGTFFCNQSGQCMTARGFKGGACQRDAECTYPGEVCGRLTTTEPTGFCMLACGPERTCPAPGGVPHACRPQVTSTGDFDVDGAPWVCWPGYFGQLCSDDKQCFPGLACQQLDPRKALAKICTLPCAGDADCDAHHFTREGYCDTQTKLCRGRRADGDPCDYARQCSSNGCNGLEGNKKCDPTPGY